MAWYWIVLALIPIPLGVCLGFVMGRDHESRQHAQRRRTASEDEECEGV